MKNEKGELILVIEHEDWPDDNCMEEIVLPTRKEVCPRCDGNGVHDHPAFSNGITAEEMHEYGDDFREDYCRGAYDVQCEECSGLRVVDVVDEDKLSDEHRTAWRSQCEDEAQYAAEVAAERRMGA